MTSAELSRGLAGELPERARKVALARKSEALGDARQMHLRLGQHLLRPFELRLHHVLVR